MSLDVYLTLPGKHPTRESTGRIYIRRDGATVEITRDEWDELNPGVEPVVMTADIVTDEVYTANITHNLGPMADECGLYEPLWLPDEIGITVASQLVEPLREGLERLRADRERLQEFNPANGWGNYDLLVRFTASYLAACLEWPDATVEVSR